MRPKEWPLDMEPSSSFFDSNQIPGCAVDCGSGAEMFLTKPNEAVVVFGNGGYIRIESDGPLRLFIEPNGS